MSDTRDSSLGWHVSMRLKDDRRVATTPSELRTAARIMLEQGRGILLAFSLVDTHVHALVAGPRGGAGAFTRHVESALKQRLRLPVPFVGARLVEIRSPWHMGNTFQYILRQYEHHGVDLGGTLDGTSLQDWLGCRLLDEGLAARVSLCVPRLQRTDLAPWSGRPAAPLRDGDHLLEAAAGVIAEADLSSMSAAACEARITAVHLGLQVLDPADVAECLKLSLRSVQRLRKERPDGRYGQAILRQVQLRQLAAEGVKLITPKPGASKVVVPLRTAHRTSDTPALRFELPGSGHVSVDDTSRVSARAV